MGTRVHSFPTEGETKAQRQEPLCWGSWPGPFSTGHAILFHSYDFYFIFTVFVVTKGMLVLCEATRRQMETCKWGANPSHSAPPGWRELCVQGRAMWVQLVFEPSSVSYLLSDLGEETPLPRVSVFLSAKWGNYMYL